VSHPPGDDDRGDPFERLRAWESLADRRIRRAMEDGEFDDLPHQGRRIPIDDDGSELALAHHVLKNAGAVPSWIATDQEYRAAIARRDAVVARARRAGPPVRERDRDELRRIVDDVGRLALRIEQEAPTTRQHRPRLDLAEELTALQAAAEAGGRWIPTGADGRRRGGIGAVRGKAEGDPG
jgi:hypothetical protein